MGDLAAARGMLQMMKIRTADNIELAVGQKVGVSLPVSWVNIPDPDPVPRSVVVSGVTMSSVFKQGLDAGGAIFRRLEGIWMSQGKVYFDSTNGGEAGMGQIWVYDPRAETVTMAAIDTRSVSV